MRFTEIKQFGDILLLNNAPLPEGPSFEKTRYDLGDVVTQHLSNGILDRNSFHFELPPDEIFTGSIEPPNKFS